MKSIHNLLKFILKIHVCSFWKISLNSKIVAQVVTKKYFENPALMLLLIFFINPSYCKIYNFYHFVYGQMSWGRIRNINAYTPPWQKSKFCKLNNCNLILEKKFQQIQVYSPEDPWKSFYKKFTFIAWVVLKKIIF